MSFLKSKTNPARRNLIKEIVSYVGFVFSILVAINLPHLYSKISKGLLKKYGLDCLTILPDPHTPGAKVVPFRIQAFKIFNNFFYFLF